MFSRALLRFASLIVLLSTLFACQTQGENPSLADLKGLLNEGSFAIISAERNMSDPLDARLTEEALAKRQERLAEILVHKGFQPFMIQGRYGGQEETSYLVPTPCIRDARTILDLGQAFQQEAVILTRQGQNALIFTNGKKRGKAHLGQGWTEAASPSDDHSLVVSREGHRLLFRLNFDFTQLLDYALPLAEKEKDCALAAGA